MRSPIFARLAVVLLAILLLVALLVLPSILWAAPLVEDPDLLLRLSEEGALA